MWKILGIAGLFGLLASPSWAQQNVITSPYATGNTNGSTTIVATNTFQRVFTSNSQRKGCAIQNTGTNAMYVTVGLTTATSTLAKSVKLAAGDVYHCTDSGVVLTGEVDITGTISETFYAAQY